jgi:hypothetical protein
MLNADLKPEYQDALCAVVINYFTKKLVNKKEGPIKHHKLVTGVFKLTREPRVPPLKLAKDIKIALPRRNLEIAWQLRPINIPESYGPTMAELEGNIDEYEPTNRDQKPYNATQPYLGGSLTPTKTKLEATIWPFYRKRWFNTIALQPRDEPDIIYDAGILVTWFDYLELGVFLFLLGLMFARRRISRKVASISSWWSKDIDSSVSAYNGTGITLKSRRSHRRGSYMLPQ